jgi:exosortase/archaeosortase family protein
MFKNYFERLKKDFKNKKKVKDSFYFLFFFLISFISIYLILAKSILYNFINYFYGSTSSKLLNLIYNIPSSFYYDFVEKITYLTIPTIEYPIAIVFLCTGILEFSLIFSAIVATIKVPVRKKIKWVLLASLIVIFFNLLRITFTIFIIYSFNLNLANFFHGFLFRLFLLIIVVGIYYFYLRNSYVI